MNTRRRGGHGGYHDETQLDPFRAIHNQAFGLQNGCRTRSERRVWRETSLQMSGSAYGIRTRVTAVRGRPEGMPREDQRSASGHGKSQELWPFAAKIRAQLPNPSQRRQSRTEDLGCRMIADGTESETPGSRSGTLSGCHDSWLYVKSPADAALSDGLAGARGLTQQRRHCRP